MTDQKAALRVAVAKDVLARIVPDENITVKTMTYLKTDGETPCAVCAIGGLVLSALENSTLAGKIGHRKTLSDVERLTPYAFKTLARQVLGRVFEDEQLGMIEAAFEGELEGFWGNPSRFTVNDETYDAVGVELDELQDELAPGDRRLWNNLKRARNYGVKTTDEFYEDSQDLERELLAAIMQNIIDNDGTFVA